MAAPRERWTDDRLDELDQRVDQASDDHDTREAIAAVPSQVIALRGQVDKIDERSQALSEAHGRMRQDVRDLRGEHDETRRELAGMIGDLRKSMERRFDQVDGDHAAAAKSQAEALEKADAARSFRTQFWDAMKILIPIFVALIAAYVALKTAVPQQPAR
jgi:chromosome segregation ATPase